MIRDDGCVTIRTRDRWEDLTAWPLAITGLAFIVVYSIYVLTADHPVIDAMLLGVLTVFWVMFAADVGVRLVLSPRGQRADFVRRNPLDITAVFLPVFRALHSVSLLQRLPVFQGVGGDAVRARTVVSMLAYALVYIWFLALSTLRAERDAPGATITSLGDAIWWACVTVFTVGYGDVTPVTIPGRFYAVMLMIGGVVIIAVSSAVVVSLLTERIRHPRSGDPDRAADEHAPAP